MVDLVSWELEPASTTPLTPMEARVPRAAATDAASVMAICLAASLVTPLATSRSITVAKVFSKATAPTLRIAPAIDSIIGMLSTSMDPANAGSDKTLPAEAKKPLVSSNSFCLRCIESDCLDVKYSLTSVAFSATVVPVTALTPFSRVPNVARSAIP